LPSTSRTATESESKALTGDAVGTALAITALTNAHTGVTPLQCELGNLTRNIKIRQYNTTYYTKIIASYNITAHIEYAEFSYIGSSTATGILSYCSTGTFYFRYNSVHDSANGTLYWASPSSNSSGNDWQYNIFYNCNTLQGTNVRFFDLTAMPITTTNTFSYNLCIQCKSSSGGAGGAIIFSSANWWFITFNNNTFAGCTSGGGSPSAFMLMYLANSSMLDKPWENNVFHSNGETCIETYYAGIIVYLKNCRFIRNNS
jgi:hypothetical protein